MPEIEVESKYYSITGCIFYVNWFIRTKSDGTKERFGDVFLAKEYSDALIEKMLRKTKLISCRQKTSNS